jgi:hypothetical protein
MNGVRRLKSALWTLSGLAFAVMITHFLARLRPDGAFEWPRWAEVVVGGGIASIAILFFLFVIERWSTWGRSHADPNAEGMKLPEFHPVDTTWLGVPRVAARTTHSLVFILAAAVGFAFFGSPARSRGGETVPVHQARGGDLLRIDARLNGNAVVFSHTKHQEMAGGKDSCPSCHHMNLPGDRSTACSRCHRDLFLRSDAFRHDWHAAPAGAAKPCSECHPLGQDRRASTAAACSQCHKDLFPAGSTIPVKQYMAPGYAEAMHRLCIGCHAQISEEMSSCVWCHKDQRKFRDGLGLPGNRNRAGREVTLPPVASLR